MNFNEARIKLKLKVQAWINRENYRLTYSELHKANLDEFLQGRTNPAASAPELAQAIREYLVEGID